MNLQIVSAWPIESLLYVALLCGHVELTRYILESNKFTIEQEKGDFDVNVEMFENAVLSGNFLLVEYLINKYGFTISQGILNIAVGSGLALALIQTYNLQPNEMTLFTAVQAGDLCLVQVLFDSYQIDISRLPGLIHPAIESGNLQLVQYLQNRFGLHLENEFGIKTSAWINAIYSNTREMLNYVENLHKTFFGSIDYNDNEFQNHLDLAIEMGKLTAVKYFLNHGVILKHNVLNLAASSGNLELYKYLSTKKGLKRDEITFIYACISNNADARISKYLLQNSNIDECTFKRLISQYARITLKEFVNKCNSIPLLHFIIPKKLLILSEEDLQDITDENYLSRQKRIYLKSIVETEKQLTYQTQVQKPQI